MFDYLITIAFLIVADAMWLSLYMGPYYKRKLGYVMPEKVHIQSAFLFYIVFTCALLVFVIWPHDAYAYTAGTNFLRGALLGLLAYTAYDVSNHIGVKGWSWHLTIIDLLWGACMTGAVVVFVTLL